jgi:hypothetical protein
MESMKYENVEKVLLSHPNIHYAKCDREGFCRSFAFCINDQFYSIVWFKNVMTLHFNKGCELKFASFELSGTWPNRAIWNLQFYDDRGETVCIIPVEDVRHEIKEESQAQTANSRSLTARQFK